MYTKLAQSFTSFKNFLLSLSCQFVFYLQIFAFTFAPHNFLIKESNREFKQFNGDFLSLFLLYFFNDFKFVAAVGSKQEP